MKTQVRVAIIGLGYWGPNLLRNFNGLDTATVAACCDLDDRRFAKFLGHYPSVRFTTDFESVLKDSSIDAVAIATPVRTHYEVAKKCLLAGKHVLIEKPLTMQVNQAEELVEVAQKNGLTLMVDHVFVFSPPVEKMKEIIDAGQLGRLYFIDSVRINLGLFQNDINVIWDLAPHDLSIVDFLLGRLPLSLAAHGSSHAGGALEDVAYLNLDYGDGLIANFHVNWLSPVKIRHMIIGGSSQSLVYDDLNSSEKIKVYNKGITVVNDEEQRRQSLIAYRSGDIWSPNLSMDEPLTRMANHFVDCIQNGKTCRSGGTEGLRVVKLLAAAQESIKAGGSRINL
ncbi:MAG: Gfo/Idh/MocA family oxidoreductase [Verrucomicrobiota bacterium]|nr:Gfo/Idh/MocA family oxidoreductase [Verrucomicrobiota bacterium]